MDRCERVARELMRWFTPLTKWESASDMQRKYYLAEADRILAILGEHTA